MVFHWLKPGPPIWFHLVRVWFQLVRVWFPLVRRGFNSFGVVSTGSVWFQLVQNGSAEMFVGLKLGQENVHKRRVVSTSETFFLEKLTEQNEPHRSCLTTLVRAPKPVTKQSRMRNGPFPYFPRRNSCAACISACLGR